MFKLNSGLLLRVGFLAGLAYATYSVLPSRHEIPGRWDAAAITLQRPLYEEQRRLLQLHLPGLFPVRFTCHFLPTKGEARTLLPGDSVQGLREGGSLRCSNGNKFYLHPKSVARLWSWGDHQALLEVESGWVSGEATGQPFRLRLGGAELELRPEIETRILATAGGREGNYLQCMSGRAELVLNPREAEPLLLEAKKCSLRAGNAVVAEGERVYVADLSIASAGRPAVKIAKRVEKVEEEAALAFAPPALPASAAAPAPASVAAPAPAPDLPKKENPAHR